MKAIRRSLKGEKEPKPHHISVTPKSALAILPPKKVIKALYDYNPGSENFQELAFTKGDFFHVISREDDPDWYEACNPLFPNARGLVPVSFFETIGKNERDSGDSAGAPEDLNKQPHDSGFSDQNPQTKLSPTSASSPNKQGPSVRMSALGKAGGAMVYGLVQYDFNAERPDELDAKAGEAIIVIAQSNPEWFVAKPIGRLGGPGLIPVSFIEIRDMTTGQSVTDPHEAVNRAGVPRVEEWKKMTAEYKNSSISLGKFEGGGGGGGGGDNGVQSATNDMQRMTMSGGQPNGNDPYNQRNSENQSPYHSQQQPQGYYPVLAPMSASIPRYCFDNDKYWYIIEAQMEDGRWWELSRFYHDFYDFQIALLSQFEEEAGNRGKPRTLPFMPGPVTHVTNAISNGRRQNLDEYMKKLLAMPPHISRCQLVKQLFAPRPGDFEIDPTVAADEYRASEGSQRSSGQALSRTASRQSSQGHTNNPSSHHSAGSMRPPSSSQRPSLHKQGSSLSQSNGRAPSRAEPQQQNVNRQGTTTGALKIKVFFQSEIIAIRVPSDTSLQQLVEKLQERLKVNEEIIVRYKDDPSNTFVELLSDNDLASAVQRNAKLTLYVGLA